MTSNVFFQTSGPKSKFFGPLKFFLFGLKNILLGLKSEMHKSTRVFACPRLRLGLANLPRVDFRTSLFRAVIYYTVLSLLHTENNQTRRAPDTNEAQPVGKSILAEHFTLHRSRIRSLFFH